MSYANRLKSTCLIVLTFLFGASGSLLAAENSQNSFNSSQSTTFKTPVLKTKYALAYVNKAHSLTDWYAATKTKNTTLTSAASDKKNLQHHTYQRGSLANTPEGLVFDVLRRIGNVYISTGIGRETPHGAALNSIKESQGLLCVETVKKMSYGTWEPVLTLSYLRSQASENPAQFPYRPEEVGGLHPLNQGMEYRSMLFHTPSSNVEVLGTRCEFQPRDDLSLTLSYRYLKKKEGEYASNRYHCTQNYTAIKTRGYGQEVDIKLAYQHSPGVNMLLTSGYFLKGNTFIRDRSSSEDEILVIEGSIVVSF